MIGKTIGNYAIQERIGKGGTGRVYLGVHTEDGRRAAIKILNPAGASDPETIDRFTTEARIVSNVRHPNIVCASDFGHLEDGVPYIIMEFLEGETLEQVLKRGPPPLDDAIDWACQVANALLAAHEQCIIHRDLKPANLFLVPDCKRPGKYQVKVLDFGIAKLQQPPADEAHRTQTGTSLGSPAYMSPEQRKSSKEIDARSDIYSLGVILYEMVIGKLPFDAEGVWAPSKMRTEAPSVAPRDHRVDLSADVEATILQALATNPIERQSSMAEVLHQLELARGNLAAAHEALRRPRHNSAIPLPVATFGRLQILAFLGEVDSLLEAKVDMEIVGGAAALLAYGARRPTKDINCSENFDERILRAAALAKHRVPLNPMQSPTKHVFPAEYEERRWLLEPAFPNIRILVPERHDLMLMKCIRASPQDVQVIREMHEESPFDLDTIVSRYNAQGTRAFRNLETLANVDYVIERLFGSERVRPIGHLERVPKLKAAAPSSNSPPPK
jgi:serine/threonine protein kinase